ncbi:uncharacterized protein LOC143229845 isoform X2 [Tachypleus tridentatus]|uniref:uncharacterized protein LOC143229845 isoform X2 n=1 Tax=Tachypleus tridentatus TaxID=6853 RepID=UPI003FCFE03D
MVNRKNWTPSHHAKLCQDHFERLCFVSDPTVLDSVYFKPGRLRLKKPSAVDRIVPTIFPRVELRADLSLQCSGSTPLKPSLAITKRINLKLTSLHLWMNGSADESKLVVCDTKEKMLPSCLKEVYMTICAA